MDAAPFYQKDIPNQRINPRVIITDFLWLSSRKIKYFSKILGIYNIAQCDIMNRFEIKKGRPQKRTAFYRPSVRRDKQSR